MSSFLLQIKSVSEVQWEPSGTCLCARYIVSRASLRIVGAQSMHLTWPLLCPPLLPSLPPAHPILLLSLSLPSLYPHWSTPPPGLCHFPAAPPPSFSPLNASFFLPLQVTAIPLLFPSLPTWHSVPPPSCHYFPATFFFSLSPLDVSFFLDGCSDTASL